MAIDRPTLPAPAEPRPYRALLLAAAVVTVVGWQFPLGRQLLYPFTLLATYAHEMGHGLTALLVGADFHALVMNPDGSGLAQWSGDVGRLGRGLVAAGGLVGPSIAGVVLLLLSKRIRRSDWLLLALAVLMGATVLLFARSLFAVAFVGGAALVFAAIARFAPRASPFLLHLSGVQLCLSVFRDLDYMFSGEAMVDGVRRVSDSAALADALFLPYWFWGGVVALFSFAVLALGLSYALRRPQS